MYIHICIYISIYIYIYIYMYIYISLSLSLSLYIYIYVCVLPSIHFMSTRGWPVTHQRQLEADGRAGNLFRYFLSRQDGGCGKLSPLSSLRHWDGYKDLAGARHHHDHLKTWDCNHFLLSTDVCMYIPVHSYMCLFLHICTMDPSLCLHIITYTYVWYMRQKYMYMCIYIYIYIHI